MYTDAMENRIIYVLFIFWLFLTRCDPRSLPGEKIFL